MGREIFVGWKWDEMGMGKIHGNGVGMGKIHGVAMGTVFLPCHFI